MEHFSIYTNNNLDQVYTATKVCVRGELKEELDYRLKTIRNSVGKGHESVLEHANLIMGFILKKSELFSENMFNLLEACNYLHYRNYDIENTDNKLLIIAGSIRGFKQIFRNIKSMTNPYLEAVKSELYDTTLADYYQDFINDNIMDANKFIKYIKDDDAILVKNESEVDVINKGTYKVGKIEFLHVDKFRRIQEDILAASTVVIPLSDLFDFCTITIKFNHISRTASHQLVRHRNAISQESQRYVNYKDSLFINPYDEDYEANHLAADNENFYLLKNKLDEFANKSVELYEDLVTNYNAKKENARAILVSNVETTLIMTFTFKNLIKAIELRTDLAAQSEIRNLFNIIKDIFAEDILQLENPADMYDYICTCSENNYYADISGIIGDYSYEEPVGDIQEVTEELTDKEVDELKQDLEKEYGNFTDNYKISAQEPIDSSKDDNNTSKDI